MGGLLKNDNQGANGFYSAFHPLPCCRNGNTLTAVRRSLRLRMTNGGCFGDQPVAWMWKAPVDERIISFSARNF